MEDQREPGRLLTFVRRRPWLTSVMNATAGLLFVVGCAFFYSSSTWTAGVTLFLAGSVVMTVSVLVDAYHRFGPGD